MDAHNRQVQIELFSTPEQNCSHLQERRNSFFNVNLSVENIIFLAIICIMLIILSFSLGVEKGKKTLAKAPVAVVVNKITTLPEKAAPKTLPALGAKNYTIQVASLEKQDSVDKEVNKLKNLGHEAWAVSKGKYSVIFVGRFASKEEAEGYKIKLPKRYNGCFVRRI